MTYFLAGVLSPDRGELFRGKEAVGVVELRGLIISPEETIRQLTSFRRNKGIKAILLRIDSPGGAVGASQEIYAEVKRTNEVKPVVATMASMAASGGFYAAMGAEKIIANPGTLTGSIGVIVKFANLQELFAKVGYRSEVIKSGKLKDIGAPDRALAPEERQMLQGVIDSVHRQFVADVAASRSLPEQQVAELADGRIFSGETAKELGLIDELGNFTDAVKLASSLAGLETDTPQLVYPEEKGFSLLQLLAGGERAELFVHLFRTGPILAYEWLLAP
jgi:protease-4